MKKSRFTETQIVSILKEADAGVPVKEIWRKYGISSATYYSWKAKYGGLEASQLKRLKELEGELSQYKRMYAELAHENYAQGPDPERALGPSERREAVRYLVETHDMPVQRACAAVGLARSSYYEPRVDWLSRDREVIEALQSLADQYPRRGFWKYHKMLRRSGRSWNHKRVYRVYCELKLNHRRRAKRRIPVRQPRPLWIPDRPNVVWSADFMSDALYHGRRLTPLEEGMLTLTVVATSAAGLESDPATDIAYLDKTPPAVPTIKLGSDDRHGLAELGRRYEQRTSDVHRYRRAG